MNAPQQAEIEKDSVAEAMTAVLQAQRADYTAEGHVSAEVRIDRMRRGMTSIHKHQGQLVEALSTDFGCRPPRAVHDNGRFGQHHAVQERHKARQTLDETRQTQNHVSSERVGWSVLDRVSASGCSGRD